MLQDIKRLFFRDRRRIALSALLLTLSAILGPDILPDPIRWLPTDIFALLIYLAIVPLITLHAPGHRFMVEILSLSVFVFALLGWIMPDSNFRYGAPDTNPVSGLVLFGLVTFGVHRLLWGTWSDRFTKRRGKRLTAEVVTCLDRRDLWYGMVPTPGHLEACADRDVVSIDYADRSKHVVRMILWHPPHPPRETLLHLSDVEPLHAVRLRVERRGVKSDWTEQGTMGFRILREGAELRLKVTLDMPALPPRFQLRSWIDDTLGRMMDRRLTAVEHAARAGGRAAPGTPHLRPVGASPLATPLPLMTLDHLPNGIERRAPRREARVRGERVERPT